MRISYIHIENFRGINCLTLSNLSNLNVIAGENGSGKTSILTTVKILLSWLIARIRNPKGQGLKINDNDITIGKTYCLLKIALDNGTEWSIYKQRSSARSAAKAKTDMSQLTDLSNAISERLSEGADTTLIDAYGVNRAVNETPMRLQNRQIFNPIDAISIDMSNGVNFHELFNWFRKVEDIENEKMRETGCLVPDKRLQAVRQAITEMFEGYSEFRVQRNPKAFIIKKDGVKFDFNQLSDGEKSYIALVADIARKLSITHPSLENSLYGDGIILIDEIDLHLHPSWQRSVIDNLKRIFPNCQFFITTHSPHVVSSVNINDGDRLIVVSKGNVTEITSNMYGKESDLILSDIFQMKSLRNPEVQSHIDKVWESLNAKDIHSDNFKNEMKWLKENLEAADPFFAEANLQRILIEKGV